MTKTRVLSYIIPSILSLVFGVWLQLHFEINVVYKRAGNDKSISNNYDKLRKFVFKTLIIAVTDYNEQCPLYLCVWAFVYCAFCAAHSYACHVHCYTNKLNGIGVRLKLADLLSIHTSK